MTNHKLTIALVGKPNVGKSSLFNKLTSSRDALILEVAGTTRDRQTGEFTYQGVDYELIDTAGIVDNQAKKDNFIIDMANMQTDRAIELADLVIFLFSVEFTVGDLEAQVLKKVQKAGKPYIIAINKVDKDRKKQSLENFTRFKEVKFISASENTGIEDLRREIARKLKDKIDLLPPREPEPEVEDFPDEPLDKENTKKDTKESKETRICILGRPNVGKSTLINRILGEERMIVSDVAGTTIDSVKIPANIKGKDFIFVDTAGIRRRSNVERDNLLEKFSVSKSFEAMEHSDVVLAVVSARDGIVKQDLVIIHRVINSGKTFVLLVNKWDELTEYDKHTFNVSLDRFIKDRESFKIHYISAKHGTGVGEIFKLVDKLVIASQKQIGTHKLVAVIEELFEKHQPALVSGKRAKVKYAKQTGNNPITFLLFGNHAILTMQDSYKRYLLNELRKVFNLSGLSIRLVFRTAKNPFDPDKDLQETTYMG